MKKNELPVVFDFVDYKPYLLAWIASQQGARGTQARLAKAAGCGSSYLSQVLKGHLHLSVEQGIGIASLLALKPLETEYLVELVQLGRAGTPSARKHFQSRLRRLAGQQFSAKKVMAGIGSIDERRGVIASSWLHSAVRTLCQLPGYQDVASLANRLLAPQNTIEAVIADLVGVGLLEERPGRGWKSSLGPVAFSPDSYQSRQFRSVWLGEARERTLVPAGGLDEMAGYVSVYTLGAEDVLKLRQAHTNFVDRVNIIKKQSKDVDDAYCVIAQVFRL